MTSDSGSTWSQRSKVVASDGAAGDQFGWSVSIYGNIAVIGSRYDDDKGSDSGNSHIYIDINECIYVLSLCIYLYSFYIYIYTGIYACILSLCIYLAFVIL